MKKSNNPSIGFILLATIIVIADLIFKSIVNNNLSTGELSGVLGGMITIGKVRTVRMAFGLGGGGLAFDIITIVVQLAFFVLFVKIQRIKISPLFKLSSSLIIFGWFGNYLDRFMLGNSKGYMHLDYIYIFKTFTNLSSMMALVGWGLFIIAIIIHFREFKSIFKKRRVAA